MKSLKIFSLLIVIIAVACLTTEAQVVKVVNNNVGIGFTNPTYKLQVNGDVYGNWIRAVGTRGLYAQTYGLYLQALSTNYWATRSDRGIVIRNRAGTNRGYVYHDNSNAFGLLDGDGNWAMRIQRDSYTRFSINNIIRMTIHSNGRTEIPSGSDATGAQNTGYIEVGNNLRIDNNEIITNSGNGLYLQHDNGGDFFVDGGSLFVDASTNRVQAYRIDDRSNTAYYLDPSSISRVNMILPRVDNVGYCGTSASTWNYGYFRTLYRTNEFTLSDRRAKENIRDIDNALDKIKLLDGKLFNYKSSLAEETSFNGFDSNESPMLASTDPVKITQTQKEVADNKVEDGEETPNELTELSELIEEQMDLKSAEPDISQRDLNELENAAQDKERENFGFIAQEVQQILPEIVDYDEKSDVYSMSYSSIIPILVEAMKEQQDMIDAQQVLLEKQQEQINALRTLINQK